MARLKILERFDSPVREASGLCVFDLAGVEHLAVVGDRDTTIAWAALTDGRPGEWNLLDVADVTGVPATMGQFEGVADAGDGRLLVLGEEPAMIVMLDPAARVCLDWWHVSTGDRPDFAELWNRDDNSRGEGLVPLPDGHLLLVKEKDPVLAIEVGPSGRRATLWQPLDGPWQAPAEHELSVLHWVEVADAPGDISDCHVRDGVLVAVSDQDRCLVVLSPDQESVSAGPPFRLDKKIEKPEGLAITADGYWWVAMDTADGKGALVSIEPPDLSRDNS